MYDLSYLFRVPWSIKLFKFEGENTEMTIFKLILKSYETDQVSRDFTKCVVNQITKKTEAKHVNIMT